MVFGLPRPGQRGMGDGLTGTRTSHLLHWVRFQPSHELTEVAQVRH